MQMAHQINLVILYERTKSNNTSLTIFDMQAQLQIITTYKNMLFTAGGKCSEFPDFPVTSRNGVGDKLICLEVSGKCGINLGKVRGFKKLLIVFDAFLNCL